MFTLQVLGAVAQLERALISERTKAGITAAVARGRRPGNPGLRVRDPHAIQKVRSASDCVYMTKLLSGLDDWLPIVSRMRPDHSWDDIVRALNGGQPSNKLRWTSARLRRSVKRLIKEGLASPHLVRSMPQRVPENRLLNLVAGISIANGQLTLRQIAAQLEAVTSGHLAAACAGRPTGRPC